MLRHAADTFDTTYKLYGEIQKKTLAANTNYEFRTKNIKVFAQFENENKGK